MHRIFTDQSIFRYFPREIVQFESTWTRFGKDKTMRPQVRMSSLCRHVSISPCFWSQLVTEVPVGIWIRDNFKLKIDQSVKTPVVTGIWDSYSLRVGLLEEAVFDLKSSLPLMIKLVIFLSFLGTYLFFNSCDNTVILSRSGGFNFYFLIQIL